MVNYKGPPKKWTDAEKKELTTLPHSYGIDEATGHEIIELPRQPVTKSKIMQEIESRAKEFTDNRNGNNPFPKTMFDVDKDE